ncbi:MAG: diacylglycerol kinase family lipid kinase [Bacteroidota bacterium]|nr:diacylglycerol kinase family lipid kinase [Bacteroidota bacterium]
MPPTGYLKILFVINPISGGTDKQDWESDIRNYFQLHPHTIEFFILSGKNDAASILQSIEKTQPDRVVAVGGDGTVTLVAKQIIGKDIAMGILPAGSANGMAKELEIPININDALDVIVHGEIKNADLININNEICLHMSDIGLNAELIKYFVEGHRRGKWGYLRVLSKVLWKKRVMYVTVKTKDVEIKRKAFVVVLANASKSGFGAVVNPVGSLDDGFFEVIIVRRLAITELFKMWFRPQPFNPEKIEIIQATSVSIETLHKVHFQVDGEYLGKVTYINANILPGKLKLLLPAKEVEINDKNM